MIPINHDFIIECDRITKEYEKLKGRWSAEAQILHIIDETMEFWDAIRKKTPADMHEEFADIILTTLATANYFGISPHQINDSLRDKLDKVQERVSTLQKR